MPGSIGPSAATLNFTRNGDNLSGVLRSEGQEFPLFDVKQMGAAVSFTLVIPGTPYETIRYSGTVETQRLTMRGLGEKQGAYTLNATRQGLADAVAVAPEPTVEAAASVAPEAPIPAPMAVASSPPASPAMPTPVPEPQLALAPDPPQVEATPPAPEAPPTPAPSAPSQEQASLSPAGPVETPGAPRVEASPPGTLAAPQQEASLSPLPVRPAPTPQPGPRIDDPPPAPVATPQQQASLQPPPAPPPAVPPPRVIPALPSAPPSPASARPATEAAPTLTPLAPPSALPLPALRDVPPNGMALTPPMGWSSRQKLGSRTNDAAIRQAVEGLVASGLNLIGYVHVEIGDGWQGVRDPKGVLHPNERFPDMKALGDYIHSQGLKFGLTTSVGPKSCNGFEGSHAYELQDARTFAEWGVDYVVYDWCGAEMIYTTQVEMRAAFQLMGDSLRLSGRDMVYVVSQKGRLGVELWAARTGANVWRIGNELEENWASVSAAGFDQNGKETAAKPGGWNDPGLLQVGNSGLSADESRMQLNLWAILAAPFMLGNDVRIMMRETVALLSNREIIAVNQDRLGRQGKRVAQSGDTQVWARPLADGSVAVALFNTGTRTTSVAVNWQQLGIEGPRTVRDLWWHENVGMANNRYVVVLAAGTSMLLKLSP